MEMFLFVFVFCVPFCANGVSLGGKIDLQSTTEYQNVQRMIIDNLHEIINQEKQEKQRLDHILLKCVEGKNEKCNNHDNMIKTLAAEKKARQKLEQVVNTLQSKIEESIFRQTLDNENVSYVLEQHRESLKQEELTNAGLQLKINELLVANNNLERKFEIVSNELSEVRKQNEASSTIMDKLKTDLGGVNEVHEQILRNISLSVQPILGQIEQYDSDISANTAGVKRLQVNSSTIITNISTIEQKFTSLSQDVAKVKTDHIAMNDEVKVLKELDLANVMKRTNDKFEELKTEIAAKTRDMNDLQNVTFMIRIDLNTVRDNYTGIVGNKFNETCRTDFDCMEKMMCTNNQCICHESYWNGTLCSHRKGNKFKEACQTDLHCMEKMMCTKNQCICHESYWNGTRCSREKAPKECSDLDITESGIYTVYNSEYTWFDVYCLIDNGTKWTVFQRGFGIQHSVDCNSYKNGFGNLSGDFWLGNDLLHSITVNGKHKLRVNLTDWNGLNFHAEYSTFAVASESDKYRLTVTGYDGNTGNLLEGVPSLSAKDNCHDMTSSNCDDCFIPGSWFSDGIRISFPGMYKGKNRRRRQFRMKSVMMTTRT